MAIGQLKTGKENIKRSAESNGRTRNSSSYTPFLSWKNDEVKTLHFLTPIDEVPEVMLHQFVRKIVTDDTGNRRERWLTFMCRKDPAWREESNNKCPLCDEIGHKATKKFVALAVELEPVVDGKRITDVQVKYNPSVDKDGNEVDYPAIGLVVQGPKFFGTLVAHDQKRDIADLSWEITREGERLATQYIFYPVDHKPDLSSVQQSIPNLLEIMEYLGSEEKYEKDLDGVRPEDQPNYGQNNSGNKTTPVAAREQEEGDLFGRLKSSLEDQKVSSY